MTATESILSNDVVKYASSTQKVSLIMEKSTNIMYATEVLDTPRSLSKEFRKLFNADTICLYEEFKVLFFDSGNNVIGHADISIGDLNSTIADVGRIMALALLFRSSSIALCHNHPTGNGHPSNADIRVTDQIKTACAYHNITLVDHIILTEYSYFSFAENGYCMN